MTKFPHCVEQTDVRIVQVEERGKVVSLKNDERSSLRKVKVDGCVICDTGCRADWIIQKHEVGSVIVELKGRDLSHAYAQVLRTLEHENCSCFLGPAVGVVIVTARRPKYSTAAARVTENLRKKGVKVRVASDRMSSKFEELI